MRVNRLGDDEYRLALSKAGNKSDVNEIVELIETFRAPWLEGRVANLGSMVVATPEQWQRVADAADSAARREMLRNSSVLSELNALEATARAAQEARDAKPAELQEAWDQFSSAIPDKLDAINARLDAIANELASLDTAKIEADFKNHFRAKRNGVVGSPVSLDALAALLVTAPLHREVLEDMAKGLEAEASELKSRRAKLSKKLGRKA
jgi:hypothetical protein